MNKQKLVTLLSLTVLLVSCSSAPPGRVEEVRNPDGTSSKMLISNEYPYSDFVELYPNATVKTCAKPLEKADVQPTVYLAYNGNGKGPTQLAEWYKERLEGNGFRVTIEKLPAATTVYAKRDADKVSISIIGTDADGMIEMRAEKEPQK